MKTECGRRFDGAARLIGSLRTKGMRRVARTAPLLAAIGATLLGLAGCASHGPSRSQLDEAGRTWVSMEAPVALARAAPRFSHAARDYLYLAPVEANDAGTRRHYIWVGFGTTVDRLWSWAAPPDSQTLLLVLDGTPLALPLESWDGREGEGLYRPPVPTYAVRRASVSLDQLTRIAAATAVEALVVAGDGNTAAYELWNGHWADWSTFVAGVGASVADRCGGASSPCARPARARPH
jgi:hypothetical protein